MSKPVKTGFPDDVRAGGDWTIRFAALDPTTGANVAGVVVSLVNVGGDDGGTGPIEGTQFGPFMLVPGPGA